MIGGDFVTELGNLIAMVGGGLKRGKLAHLRVRNKKLHNEQHRVEAGIPGP